jgi:hypothetical protein
MNPALTGVTERLYPEGKAEVQKAPKLFPKLVTLF